MTKNDKQQDEDFTSKISDDINCSICLDILVSPRTLVPCGHTFCRSCCSSDSIQNNEMHRQILSFTKCPHCRQPVKEMVPSRQLESLIDTLVQVPNLLFRNDDDKQHYVKRRKAETERSRRLCTSAQSRKRRRKDDSHYAMAVNPRMFHDPTPYPSNRGVGVAVDIFHDPPTRYPSNHGVGVAVGGVAYQSATSFTSTTTRGASFDPMAAPLPPPYDFTNTGPMPILSFRMSSSDAPHRRQPPMARQVGTGGISSSDPICID